MGESRTDVETGYEKEEVEEEEEEFLESENHTVETNLKNPMRRAEQVREDCGHTASRIGVLFVSKVVVSRNILKLSR